MPAISSERDLAGEPPLVVDLDGTLLHTDLMVESMLILLKRHPWRLLLAVLQLLGGIAAFKQRLAREALPDVATLPFDRPLLDYLAEASARGRRLVLATGADEAAAAAVARHVDLFDEIIASDGAHNMSGRAKRDALVARFGEKGFDYAGDGIRDGRVWPSARRAILAGRSADAAARIGKSVQIEAVFPDGHGGWRPYLAALRPRQWTKNLLVFLPLVVSGRLIEAEPVLHGVMGWAAFCLCASSGYLFNDLMDLPSDRRHPAKMHRPLASGAASPTVALALAPLLLLSGLTLGLLLSPAFTATLAGYYVLTISYSLRLKDVAVLDVLVLSGLYTMRLFGGALACGATAPAWLLAFCIFLFLSLALIKRYAELMVMRAVEGAQAHARAYLLQDAELLAGLGAASGYVAGLVLVLFHVGRHASGALDLAGWFMCLVYLYWITHMWLMAHRAVMQDDPLTFALRDRTSQILLALAAFAFLATSPW